MPAPTNTDITTAIDLGAFPATYTQDVNDAGTTYVVWTKFTATQTGVVSIFARGVIGGGGSDYIAKATNWIGPTSAPVFYPENLNILIQNVPFLFPVTEGVTYYQQFESQHGNVASANLTITAEYFDQRMARAGMLCVPDDTIGFPMAILSATDGTVRHFQLDFPPGEFGVSHPTGGAVLVDDSENRRFTLFTPTLSPVTTLAHLSATGTINNPDLYLSVGWDSGSFYAGWISSGTTMALRKLSASDLTQEDTWTLAGVNNVRACAPNAAETKLYLAGKAGGTESVIATYDLVARAFVANLAASIPNYIITDLLVLSDDTVVVAYFKKSVTRDYLIKTYDSAGLVLQSKSYGSAIQPVTPSRITLGLDDVAFWLMEKNSDITSTYRNVKVTDLSDIAPSPFTRTDFEFGAYQGTQTATPAMTGASESCPVFLLRGSVPTTTHYTIRRQRRFLLPSSPNNRNMRIPTLELLCRTGIGLTPGAASDPPVLGSDPQVMLRISKDGGKTWGPERAVSMGQIGRFKDRVRWLQATGNYRQGVVELTISDPVDVQWLAMVAPNGVIEGTS